MIKRLRYWYESDTLAAHRFRYGLLGFDIVTGLVLHERTLVG